MHKLSRTLQFIPRVTPLSLILRVPDRARRPRVARRPPCRQNQADHVVDALILPHAGEHRRAIATHEL